MNPKNKETEYIREDSDDPEAKIKKIGKLLKRCKSEKQEYLDGWQRVQADFQNYIKQRNNEMQEFQKFASQESVLKIFPVLDNLILACDAVPEKFKDDSWAKGIVSIKKQFEDILDEQGIKEVKVRGGDMFDPSQHEAAEEIESKEKSGTIAEVLQKGYTLNGKVIRAARVKVAK